LTILLDIAVEDGLKRKKDKKPDRFETENVGFHRRVREGYLKLAGEEPERWMVIDALKNKDEIAGIIWRRISSLISK